MLRQKAYKWHRWSSAIAAVPLLMWASSGLLHQAGAWFKPDFKPQTHQPSLGVNDVEKATELIYHLYQRDVAVESVRKISSFDHNYSKRNKVLPVYEMVLATPDRTTLYVDVTGGRIITGSNRTTKAIHRWFGYLHKLSFLDRAPIARASLLIALSAVTLFAGWLGVYLYFLLPAFSKSKPLQTSKLWHRRLGIMMSLFMMLFAFTGLTHAAADLVPSFATYEKPLFDQLHMWRALETWSKPFRFWWLFGIAALMLAMIGSGLVLLLKFVCKKAKLNARKTKSPEPGPAARVLQS
jgi:uncharacterized iron-regulated membrane protein